MGAIVRFAAATAEANASAQARAAAQRAGLRPTTSLGTSSCNGSLSWGVEAARARRMMSVACNTDAPDETAAAQAEAARLRAELQQAKTDLAASQQRVLALSLVTASPAPPNGGAGAGGGSGDGGTGRTSSGRPQSPTTSLVNSLTLEEAHLVLGKIAHLTSSLNQLVVGSAASVLEGTRPT